MKKRGGIGYLVGGFASAASGSCSIECPACPRILPPLDGDDLSNERPPNDFAGQPPPPNGGSNSDGEDSDPDESSVPDALEVE